MEIQIRKDSKNTVIGFNNSGIPLGKRTQEDLVDLGIMAHESQHQLLLDVFEDLPSLDKLKKQKLDLAEKKSVSNKKATNTEMVNNDAKENDSKK